MTEFSREEIDIMAMCVASYTDKYGDTYYPEVLKKLRAIQSDKRMTQKEIDYYLLLERIRD